MQSVSENLCYDSVRDATTNCNFESCYKLLENVNGLYTSPQKSNEPYTFCSSFTFFTSSNVEAFYTTVDRFTATLIAMNLSRQIHQKFLKQKEQSTTYTWITVLLTKNELDGLQYICGYVIKHLIKNLKFTVITKLINIKLSLLF